MPSVEIAVALIAWSGIIVSWFTMESFNLRQWSESIKYVFYGFIVFFVFKTIAANPLVSDLGVIGPIFKIAFIGLITYGAYKIQKTADLVGY